MHMPMLAPESLVEKLRQSRCVLFAGSGLSAWAKLPTWSRLIELLIEKVQSERPDEENLAELKSLSSAGKLLEVADYCKDRLGPQRFHSFLSKYLRGASEDLPKPHKVIAKLPFAGVITTNYDKLLERALPSDAEVLTHRDTDKLGLVRYNNQIFILKAHGDIDHPETLVLTASDYRELIHSNPAFSQAFANILGSNAILFVGYSLSDPDFRLMLDQQLALFGGYVPDRFALMTGVGRVESDVLWRTGQIQVLHCQRHQDVLDFLTGLTDKMGGHDLTAEGLSRPTGRTAVVSRIVSGGKPRGKVETLANDGADKEPRLRKAYRGKVFVIPDFGGSELIAIHNDEENVVWLNMFRISTGKFADLALDALGQLPQKSIKVRPGGAVRSSYASIAVSLAKRWDVEMFPYDWRNDIRSTAAQLADRLRQVLPASGCHIVAHGMGGASGSCHDPRFPGNLAADVGRTI